MIKGIGKIIVHLLFGLLSMTLLTQTRWPILFILYISIAAHAGILILTSDDVTSHPHLRLVLAMVAMEFAISGYCIMKYSSGTGALLIQGLAIAIIQTICHCIYLTTVSQEKTRTFGLGEGKGRDKLVGRQNIDGTSSKS